MSTSRIALSTCIKNRITQIVPWLMVLFIVVSCAEQPPAFQDEPLVRVRIMESQEELRLTASDGFILQINGQEVRAGSSLTVVVDGDAGALASVADNEGGRWQVREFRVESAGEEFLLEDVPYGVGWWWGGREHRTYEGQLHVYVDADSRLDAVLHLPMESYLKGVIPYEIGPESPLEALKAQAVAARAEIAQTMLTGKYRGTYHDVCADVECQVFAGNNRRSARSDSAVVLTRAEVLVYGTEVIDAYYASNCGGMSEVVEKVWPWRGGPKPYLISRFDGPEPSLEELHVQEVAAQAETAQTMLPGVRTRSEGGPTVVADVRHLEETGQNMSFGGYTQEEIGQNVPASVYPREDIDTWLDHPPASWCNPYVHTELPNWSKANFRWTREVTFSDFREGFAAVDSLQVLERGESGRIHRLAVWQQGSATELDFELAVRQMVHPPLRSSAFRWRETETGFIFEGAGWGHGVGMCQSGAVAQAIAGRNYAVILEHYFPGTRLHKMFE